MYNKGGEKLKRIVYLLILIIVSILIIPLIILKGVPPGIKINGKDPGGIINIPMEEKKSKVILESSSSGDIKIKVFIAEKNVLQEMNLEDYIRGVVAGEMPVEFDKEALKAQAVTARTYAVTRMKIFGGKGDNRHSEADICTDSTHCQEWISKEERFKNWNADKAQENWDKLTEVVNATKGLIMTYNSLPIMYALYFSTSGGKTENSKDVFTNSEPYLKSVISQYEEDAPKYASKITF